MSDIGNQPSLDWKAIHAQAEKILLEQQFSQKNHPVWWQSFSEVQRHLQQAKMEYTVAWEIPSAGDFINWVGDFEELHIAAGGLNPENGIFGDAIAVSHLCNAARQGKRMSITFGTPLVVQENDGGRSNPFYEALTTNWQGSYPDNLHLYKYKQGRPPLHFCVVDGMKLSVEYPHQEWHALRRRLRTQASERKALDGLFNTINSRLRSESVRISSSKQMVEECANPRPVTVPEARRLHTQRIRERLGAS